MRNFKRTITSLMLVVGLLISGASASFASSYPGEQHFSTGQQNQHVAQVQKWLISLGFEISVANGKYGPQTTAAIKKFYEDINNSSDGTTLGPKGWERIQAAANTSSPQPESKTKKSKKKNEVKSEQINVNSGDAKRDEKVEKVIAKAASMVGTPYRRGGTDPAED